MGSACTRQITELVIFNRWGEVIFRNQNFPPSDPASGWNGMYQGVMAGSGTYAYTLLVNYVTGQTNRSTGKILLIR